MYLISRNFLPIGQGAFYCEKFLNLDDLKELTIVYDCGGSKKGEVERKIVDTFKKDEKIDKLFISHLHTDHINGLERILEHCKVQELYFPEMTNNEKIITLIDFIEHGDLNSSFLKGLHADFESEIKDISVETKCIKIPKNNKEVLEIIKNKWILYPYNLDTTDIKGHNIDILSEINNELNNQGYKCINKPEDLLKYINQNKKVITLIKKAYNKIIKKENYNEFSMTLYSGPEKITKYSRIERIIGNINISTPSCICICNSFHFCRNLNQVACLYMGDFDASKHYNKLYNHYKKYWKSIGTLQIPHHGSKENFHRDLIKDIKFLFISAGGKNRYRHPSFETLESIFTDRPCHKVMLVTEDKKTEVNFIISL